MTSSDAPRVEVRRSARRRRTVSAYREDGVTVVLIPARMSRSDERRWVDTMVKRLEAQDKRRRPSDAALLSRAGELSRAHLDGRARPTSVRWVTNQSSRWGSCTPADGSIRLSHRLQGVPRWVVDYVLLHELVHLLVADHSAEFWALVGRYPHAERARGFLEGVAAAASGLDLGPDLPAADVDVDVDGPAEDVHGEQSAGQVAGPGVEDRQEPTGRGVTTAGAGVGLESGTGQRVRATRATRPRTPRTAADDGEVSAGLW